MQSKKSFFNAALFKKNISRTWIIGLLYFIILLIWMPVSTIISLANFEDNYLFEEGFTKVMLIYQNMSYIPAAWMGAILGIAVTGVTFWYLFFKRDNYMMHAFPVSRKSLFFTGLISSIAITVVPLLLNGLIMTLIAVGEKAYAFDAIWYWTLIAAVINIFFIALAMFSLMTSGQVATAVIFYGIFNFLYLMMEVALRITASMLLFGMGEALNGIRYTIWTPLLYMDDHMGVGFKTAYNELGRVKSFTLSFDGGKDLAIYAVAALVFIVVAYILYLRKQNETVHDFICVPWLKPVFSVGMSFFISIVAGSAIAGMCDAFGYQKYSVRFVIAIIATLIIGAILFYATQMLIEKTVRVFSVKKFTFMVGYSLAAFGFMLCLRNDVFNVENRVPSANDIQWVGIQSDYTMVFTDEDEINSVRELHKNFLKDKKELRDVNVTYKDVPGSSVSIKYKLKSGAVVIRMYSVVDPDAKEVSSEYVAAVKPIEDFLNVPTIIKEHVLGNIWNDCEIPEMSFSTFFYDTAISDYTSNYESFDYLSEREKKTKFKKVYDAVLKDNDDGKLFVTDFNGSDWYGKDSKYLYNDFSFTIKNNKIPYFSDEETFWDSQFYYEAEDYYQRSIWGRLTEECTNTLKALKDEGFYSDDEGILTYATYNQRMGIDDDDPVLY